MSFETQYGILAALAAAVLWGSWVVPLRKSSAPQDIRLLFTACGNLVLAILLYQLFPSALSFPAFAGGIIGGLLWSLAAIIALRAIDNAGLSRSTAIFGSVQILLSFLFGLILFNEFPSGGMGVLIAGAGVVLLAASAV